MLRVSLAFSYYDYIHQITFFFHSINVLNEYNEHKWRNDLLDIFASEKLIHLTTRVTESLMN